MADLDPLGISDADLDSSIPPELSLEYWLYSMFYSSSKACFKYIFRQKLATKLCIMMY